VQAAKCRAGGRVARTVSMRGAPSGSLPVVFQLAQTAKIDVAAITGESDLRYIGRLVDAADPVRSAIVGGDGPVAIDEQTMGLLEERVAQPMM